jgi:rhamnosyltransferase
MTLGLYSSMKDLLMLSAQPKIAVLLAAYNGMQWIEEQLASIQAQERVEVHIFISDDSSTDGTGAWIDAYAARHPNVTSLPPIEPCGGAARNFFHLLRDADLGSFDLVALADQDDRWHTDKLDRAASILANGSAAVYSSNVTAFWPDGRIQLLDKAQEQVQWDHYFEAAGPGCTYVMTNGFCTFLKECIHAEWHAIQEITLHDWYIYALARCNGYTWHIDTQSTLEYRQHLGNQVGANVGASALLSRYKTIRNGWWFAQVKLIESQVNIQKPDLYRPSWRSLGRRQIFLLGLQANRCRRRTRDRLLFSGLCMLTAIIGAQIK